MSNKSTVNQRIDALVKEVDGGNRSAFARRVDLTPGAVTEMIGGRLNKPSFDVLQKIARALPTLNRDWLLLGEGEMFSVDTPIPGPWDSPKEAVQWNGVEDPNPKYIGKIGIYPILPPDHNTVVPVIYGKNRNRLKWDYLRRDEGSDDPIFTKYYEPFDTLTLPPSFLEEGQHIVFPMTGNAMHPTFAEEDLLLFSLVDRSDWTSIPESAICAIETQKTTFHGASLEICRPVINAKDKTITCEYDNRGAPRRVRPISFDDVHAIWSFAWRLTSLSRNAAEQIDSLERSLYQANKIIERLLKENTSAQGDNNKISEA